MIRLPISAPGVAVRRLNWRLNGVRNGLDDFFGELGQKSVASHHRQLTAEEPVAVVPERTLLSVGDIGASGNCVLPISQAGFTCERDPHRDSSDWTASESDHLFGATNEHTECGHCNIGADITYGRRHGARSGMSERRGGRRSGRPRRRPPCRNRSRGRLHREASLRKGKRERAGASRKPTLRGRAVLMARSR